METWMLPAVAVLLALAAFFGGAETALTAASQPRMLEWERQGDARAAVVNRLRSNRERMIGSLLTAQNIVAPLAAVLTTSLFLSWFGAGGEIYATVVLSVLLIVFGEVLPKTYALYATDRTALAVAPVIAAVVRVLAPLTAGVEWIVRHVLRLFGIRAQQSIMATTTRAKGAAKTSRYNELRKMLEHRRRELMKQVQVKIRDVRAEGGKERDVLDQGESSEVDIQEDIEFALIQMKSETLNKINEALRRLDESTYGNCFECGDEIAEARLRALPFAVRCKDCEEQRETLQQRERLMAQRRGNASLFIDMQG